MMLPGDITQMAASLDVIAVCSVIALLKNFGVLKRKGKD